MAEIIKQKLIRQGRLSPDGRNKQALFFNVDPSVPSTPDGMTEAEGIQYWEEVYRRQYDNARQKM